MVSLDQPPALGAPIWVDLSTSDVPGARAFYCALFDWSCDEPDEQMGGYFTFYRDGAQVAGAAGAMPEMPTDVWSVYLHTEDAAKTVEVAVAEGGQVVAEPMAIADIGTMAFLVDPGGAAIGLWQPGTHKGFAVRDEPGAPCWFELRTRDHDRSVAFYRDAMSWRPAPLGEGDAAYTVHQPDDGPPVAGIMDGAPVLPEGVPPHWHVYFSVEDVDAAIVRVQELGGSVLVEPMDTPHGRCATVADPTGAAFTVIT